MNKIGITSTLPVEVIYSAGMIPVDLNNLFISSPKPGNLINKAKIFGFPDTTCSWICGIYSAVIENNIKTVIGVTGGDCSETSALLEVLQSSGINTITFAYPHTRNKTKLKEEIIKLAERLETNIINAEQWNKRLSEIRADIHRMDHLLWKENKATSADTRSFQLSSSDFQGDPSAFSHRLENCITETACREPSEAAVRIGFAGVPPVVRNIYDFTEKLGTRIVFSEVERQFSLPYNGLLEDIYTAYTYPYGIYARIEDIKEQIRIRNIDGIIHYVQSFCFRGISAPVLENSLGIPVLTIQGDLPVIVTETMALRLEAFVDMLIRRKN